MRVLPIVYAHVRLSDHEYIARWRLGDQEPEELLTDGRWLYGLKISDVPGEFLRSRVYATLDVDEMVEYCRDKPELLLALQAAGHAPRDGVRTQYNVIEFPRGR